MSSVCRERAVKDHENFAATHSSLPLPSARLVSIVLPGATKFTTAGENGRYGADKVIQDHPDRRFAVAFTRRSHVLPGEECHSRWRLSMLQHRRCAANPALTIARNDQTILNAQMSVSNSWKGRSVTTNPG